jgi:hydrogenase maturation factor
MGTPTAKFPAIGKVSPEFFDEIIYPRLGAGREEVLVGPKHGHDCGVVGIGDGQVMVLTTDPIFIVPEYGFERAAWFAWHILASDVTTSGFAPSYILVDFNLPMSMTEDQFSAIWEVFHRESSRYGAAVVGGHTARYTGTDYPMVGGATFMAVGPEDKFLHPGMGSPGGRHSHNQGGRDRGHGHIRLRFSRHHREEPGSGHSKGRAGLLLQDVHRG